MGLTQVEEQSLLDSFKDVMAKKDEVISVQEKIISKQAEIIENQEQLIEKHNVYMAIQDRIIEILKSVLAAEGDDGK